MDFSSNPSKVMHVDINSCFATIEQQANPNLRNKPIAVAAFTTPNGCILASSIQAKKLGVKTGMMVKEGRLIYPKLIILPPDPAKYRDIHIKLRNLLSYYSPDVFPRSIDEFVLAPVGKDLHKVALEIKQRIKVEIGEVITVSVGIAPNRYLAKVAAGIIKPDGLVEINKDNFRKIYSELSLTDLTGIKVGNSSRLGSMGITSVIDFYESPIWKLKSAFHSITGYYWYMRLRGYEVDEEEFKRRSYGNSVAIGRNVSSFKEASPILTRLVEKMSTRLRSAGYKARGIHLAVAFKDHSFWHKGHLMKKDLFETRDFLKAALSLLVRANPTRPIRDIAVSCFGLTKANSFQTELFEDVNKKIELTRAWDKVNSKWGDFTIGIAKSFKGENIVLDRIAFGGVKEL